MRDSVLTCTEPVASIHSFGRDEGNLWGVVLAGGEGVRSSSSMRETHGARRPDHDIALNGSRSPLRQALDRMALLVPPQRTVVVTVATRARHLGEDLGPSPGLELLAQPSDRGTAAGVLLPAHWIRARDPGATVVVLPAEQVITDDALYMRHVALAARYARAHASLLVLLGARPTTPDADYGWIEPGERADSDGIGAIHRVRGFWEKPSEELARTLYERGGLWNTSVLAARAGALIQAGRRSLPMLHDRLTRLALYIGTAYESWGLRQAYQFAPTADFSRAILESSPSSLAVARLPALAWRDGDRAQRAAWSDRRLTEEGAQGDVASGA